MSQKRETGGRFEAEPIKIYFIFNSTIVAILTQINNRQFVRLIVWRVIARLQIRIKKGHAAMNNKFLEYYTTHNYVSDPGDYSMLLNDLPTDMDELQRALNGILIHIWKVRKKYPRLLKTRPHEVFIRRNQNIIRNVINLDSQPLNLARPEEKRSIIDCRHFATMLCTVLRHREIPARARCGFATYLEDTHYEDHWVCEYWSFKEKRWVMEDADQQIHNVSSEQFITGGRAWQICRQDKSKGNLFGFGSKMRGMWATRVNLVRDFAALNGFESVSGDSWGLGYKDGSDLTADELLLLDEAAELSSSDDKFYEMQRLYIEGSELRMPATIHSFDHVKTRKWQMVDWQNQD